MKLKITAIPFTLGAVIMDGFIGDYTLSMAAAVIMIILVLTKQVDLY